MWFALKQLRITERRSQVTERASQQAYRNHTLTDTPSADTILFTHDAPPGRESHSKLDPDNS